MPLGIHSNGLIGRTGSGATTRDRTAYAVHRREDAQWRALGLQRSSRSNRSRPPCPIEGNELDLALSKRLITETCGDIGVRGDFASMPASVRARSACR